MNILIIRSFVRLCELLATHKDLARKLEDLGAETTGAGRPNRSIYNLVTKLITPPRSRRRPIGFIARAQGVTERFFQRS